MTHNGHRRGPESGESSQPDADRAARWDPCASEDLRVARGGFSKLFCLTSCLFYNLDRRARSWGEADDLEQVVRVQELRQILALDRSIHRPSARTGDISCHLRARREIHVDSSLALWLVRNADGAADDYYVGPLLFRVYLRLIAGRHSSREWATDAAHHRDHVAA
jgi:hypothetical protein